MKKGLEKEPFDVIFADPPYEKRGRTGGFQGPLMDAVVESGLLAPAGLMVVENRASADPADCSSWQLVDDRVYGESRLSFYGAVSPAE